MFHKIKRYFHELKNDYSHAGDDRRNRFRLYILTAICLIVACSCAAYFLNKENENDFNYFPSEEYIEETAEEPIEEKEEPSKPEPTEPIQVEQFEQIIIVYKINDYVGVTSRGEVVFCN